MIAWIPFLFVLAMVVSTIWLGVWATKQSKTASDFFVASRQVSVGWNASAISGEYLSAASFMGVAGLIMKNGYDVLWYPACYAAGYLFLLLFIAGPLRRFGAYTIPDFAEGRFDSPLFRKIAVTFVLFIGFFYTMPQMKGAGITMAQILNWPYWAGIAAVGTVITFNVALGGMKGITFVQAFQYWAKMFAISAPVFVLMSVYGGYSVTVSGNATGDPKASPRFPAESTIKVPGPEKAPANSLTYRDPVVLGLPAGTTLKINKAAALGQNKEGWELLVFDGPHGDYGSRYTEFAPGKEIAVSSDARLLSVGVGTDNMTTPTKLEFLKAVELKTASGMPVPNAPANKAWLSPFGPFTGKWGYPLLYTYSLIVALVCGTAGLPHILVRFYTNPDGRAAKRTTFWVMVLIGAFYLFPPVWGALGRAVMPQLYANSKTDAVVIALPTMLENKLLGQILSGITSAGAFAAFMSTFSGLLVSMSGALAHDIYGRILRPKSTPAQRLVAFKVAAIAFGIISMVLGYLVETFDIAMMVGWAFAIGAASYFPLLLMGSWWRGLTKYGAGIGMLTGGLLSLAAIITHMLLDKKILVWQLGPLARTLLEQPAVWGVPLALVTMYIVSRLTSNHIPHDVNLKMLRLHAPEEMGLSKNYIDH
ncbi:MAG: cation acetate symporter [Candidatus Sumerlaeaceae bacterium]|nr:cation acetate symporter [Candidatus Sumerlaeaceae bacterium]